MAIRIPANKMPEFIRRHKLTAASTHGATTVYRPRLGTARVTVRPAPERCYHVVVSGTLYT